VLAIGISRAGAVGKDGEVAEGSGMKGALEIGCDVAVGASTG
jgi:hypothetical protein